MNTNLPTFVTTSFATSFAANFIAFECCGCSTLSSQETEELELMYLSDFPTEAIQKAEATMGDRPLYAQVSVCQRCGHTCCEKHFVQGLCHACYVEVR